MLNLRSYLEIILRLFDRSNFATLGPLWMCMYASSVEARMTLKFNHRQLQGERSNRH
jgi:hypothetical protein